MLEIVRSGPGITVGDLRAALGIGWGGFYHHLFTLKRDGAVTTLVVGRRRLIFPAGYEVTPSAARSVLRGTTALRVALAVYEDPGCSVRDIVKRTGLSGRVVYYHLRRLLAHDLVVSKSLTRHHELGPSATLKVLLKEIAMHHART